MLFVTLNGSVDTRVGVDEGGMIYLEVRIATLGSARHNTSHSILTFRLEWKIVQRTPRFLTTSASLLRVQQR